MASSAHAEYKKRRIDKLKEEAEGARRPPRLSPRHGTPRHGAAQPRQNLILAALQRWACCAPASSHARVRCAAAEIIDGESNVVRRHLTKLKVERERKLRVAEVRQRQALESAEIACEAEKEIARERYRKEAKQAKEDLVRAHLTSRGRFARIRAAADTAMPPCVLQLVTIQESMEQATREAGLPPDDPLNMDPAGQARKLRERGANNKVAKQLKKKNAIPWNHGYIVRAENHAQVFAVPFLARQKADTACVWLRSSARCLCGRAATG